MRVFTNDTESPRTAYGLGSLIAGAAALLQWGVHPLVGSQVPFLFFLVGLTFAVISLGRGPAILVLLAGAINAVLLSPPVGRLAIQDPHAQSAVVLYLIVGALLIVGYGNRLRLTTVRSALSERRLALAQKNTGVGIFELNFESQTAYVSPSMCHMLGLQVREGDISLADWLAALRPGHVEESRRAMQDQITRGELRYEREQRIELPNGESRWVLNRVELEVNPSGTLRIARGAAVDITERKRADELLHRARLDLQQQLQDLSSLHAFSQDLVALSDDLPTAMDRLLKVTVEIFGASYGVVSLCDPRNDALRVAAYVGFDAKTMEDRATRGKEALPVSATVSVAVRNVDPLEYERVISSHRVLAARQGLRALQSIPLLSAQGEVMGGVSVMFTHARDPDARETRLAEVCATTGAVVLERERARTVAKSNEKRFSVALESSVVPFSILEPVRNPEGRIVDFRWTYLNPAAAQALGRSVNELTGRVVGSVLPRAWDESELFTQYVNVVERNEQREFEVPSTATNQGVRWYNVVAAPLQGSIAVWFANITAGKLKEHNLQEADKRKDDFLATLAHELRNPLAPIRQSVRIISSVNSTEAQRRWSHGIIERQVQHMALLLDDLLDVSRVGRGTLLLRKSRELLSAVLEIAIETARPLIEGKRHHLQKFLPDAPVTLDVDPVRMAQVLGNLLTNAAKYTDPGGWIQVSADQGPDGIIIRVKDNGIGLSQEQQIRVFDMFAQVPAAVERSQGGLGIGLALARGLVELHGGALEVSSAGLGLGTEFRIHLPGSCVVTDSHSKPPVSALGAATASSGLGGRILIADDNVDAADSLAELLRLEGYEVHVAYDGAEAIATAARVEPDVALLDVGMPLASGIEVVRAIRQQPRGRHATLIAVTGWGQEKDRRAALEAGFDHHLTKPMLPELVLDLIQRGRAVLST